MIGPRKHLDKIKGVEPRYTSNKVNLVKGYYGPITEKAPNPRFFRSNRALTNVSKLSLVGSAVQIYDTGTNLIQANDEGRLGEQTVIEGSKFAGARLGLTVGVEISMYLPKHPLLILGTVGATTALFSMLGEQASLELIKEAKKGGFDPGTTKDAHSPKR